MNITKVAAREIFDSRGYPTLECLLTLDNEIGVSASVPSGVSRSIFDAHELRDGGSRLGGQGVLKAIEKLDTIIAPALIGREPDIVATDMLLLALDGTENKSNLGANTTLAVSIAVCRAQALIEGIDLYELIAQLCDIESVSLPFAMFNLINGGLHGHNGLIMQEFMVVPVGAQNFRESLEQATTIFHALGDLLGRANKSRALGDEGGYAATFVDDREALDFLMEAVAVTGIKDVVFSIDVAASRLYDKTTQKYAWGKKQYGIDELLKFYVDLVESYPIYSLEDGFCEIDTEGWRLLTKEFGEDVQVVGDDLFATNAMRIKEGLSLGLANAAVIKPNQVGTVTETLQAIKLCKDHDMNVVVSHRSGETNDTFIVDLAVGSSAGQMKAGAPARGERLAKYNQLLAIEDGLMHSMME